MAKPHRESEGEALLNQKACRYDRVGLQSLELFDGSGVPLLCSSIARKDFGQSEGRRRPIGSRSRLVTREESEIALSGDAETCVRRRR